MMITYLRDDIFESPAQTIVNTVNTVGVMGKGLALLFKEKYPDMYKEYAKICRSGNFDVGRLHLWRAQDRWIINFPTKTTWKKPSQISYIEDGLKTFVESYREMGISSISFPPLGCGNGNLDWDIVKPLMERYLKKLEIPVYIHDRQVNKSFVPEHKVGNTPSAPLSFEEFLADIREQFSKDGGVFVTIRDQSKFSASWLDTGGIVIYRQGRSEFLELEYIEWAWTALQSGVLTSDQFPSANSKKMKSYLFPILASLPYVRLLEINRPDWGDQIVAHGLHFRKTSTVQLEKSLVELSTGDSQECLFQ